MQLDPPTADSKVDQSSATHLQQNQDHSATPPELTAGEIINIELYEAIPKIDREVVVRENVQIKNRLTEAADLQP